MKILLNTNVYGWKMTGLLGDGAKWFVGFSLRPRVVLSQDAIRKANERVMRSVGQPK